VSFCLRPLGTRRPKNSPGSDGKVDAGERLNGAKTAGDVDDSMAASCVLPHREPCTQKRPRSARTAKLSALSYRFLQKILDAVELRERGQRPAAGPRT